MTRSIIPELWAEEIARQWKRELVPALQVPKRKLTLWQRITWWLWGKWWSRYTNWLHRNCE